MGKGSFKWLASLACFTLGAGTLSADDYYITQATEPGSSGVCDCTVSGNSCCTFLDGINSANGLSATTATLHITPSTITYSGPATSPCISEGTVIIQPVTVGSGGTVINFAGQGSSSCSTSSVFQPTFVDSNHPGSVTLDDVVFQNSSGSSIIAIAGGTLQTNGTTNSGSNSFTGNEWDVSVNNAHQPSLIFGVLETGNTWTAPFPGNIVFTVNSTTLALTNNDTGSVTVSGDIEPSGGVTGSQLNVSCQNGGTITLSGDVTVATVNLPDTGGSSSIVALTGTSNEMTLITVRTFEILSLNAPGNIGATTEIDLDNGGLQFTAPFTLGTGTNTISLNAGTNQFDDQGNNVEIDALVTAPGNNRTYIKAGTGIQTLTNTSNSSNHVWAVAVNGGVFSVSANGQFGGGALTLQGGTFFADGDVLLGAGRALDITNPTGGNLAAGEGFTLLVQRNLQDSGPLTIGCPVASLNASGTVYFQETPGFTGTILIGALDGSNNSYPATMMIDAIAALGHVSTMTLQGGGIWVTTATMSAINTSAVDIPIQVNTGSGSFSPDPGTTLTIPGAITLSGGAVGDIVLGIAGGGTVVLSGDNSAYTGSFAVTDASTLSVTDMTNIGSNSSPIQLSTAGCTLDITGSGTMTILPPEPLSNAAFTLNMSGVGGELISSTNFLTGATTIAMASDCTLEFDQTDSGTFAGAISGTGGIVIKEGTGTLTLTGISSYTGKTYVNAGTLVVNGDISSSPDPLVASGSTLLGTGTVGATVVQSGGTIQGGNPLGTLTIDGTLLLESGSNFDMLLTPSAASLVTVTGAVTIDPNEIFYLSMEPGNYKTISRVVLMGSSITGEFAEINFVDGPLPRFTFMNLDYTGTEVILDITVFSVAPLAIGGNAIQVADALDAIIASPSTALDALITTLLPLTTEAEMTNALNQLHPAQVKGMAISQENNALRVREAVSQRMVNELNVENCFLSDKQDAEGKRCCDKNKRMMTAWVGGLGDTLVQDNVTNFWGSLTGYRINTGGVIAGIDGMFAEHFYAGVIGAYTHSHLHFYADKGTGDISSGYAGLYFSAVGSGSIGKMFYANASVIGSWSKYRGDRHIEYPGVNLTAKSHHGGNQLLSHLDTGINLNYLSITVRPFDSFDYTSQVERGYSEHNAGEWDLTLGRKNEIMMRNELGLQFAKCLCLCGSKWIFSPKISWVREVRVKGGTFDANFTKAGPSFVIHGYFPDRSLVAPGMAITGLLLNDALKIDLYYNGEFKGNYSSNSLGGQIGYSF